MPGDNIAGWRESGSECCAKVCDGPSALTICGAAEEAHAGD